MGKAAWGCPELTTGRTHAADVEAVSGTFQPGLYFPGIWLSQAGEAGERARPVHRGGPMAAA